MRDEEIPNWLKELPLAPVFYPTDTEFADPIAYISKIEKEASAYGICKVIPPLPKPSKKYVVGNLNKSLLKCPELGNDLKLNNVETINDGEVQAVFTTRHQELGHSSVKRTKEVGAGAGAGAGTGQPPPVNKQVWQSGEIYTLEQFESKSKNFARSHLSMIKEVSPLAIESLFWKAACEKPIYIEYANDVPGSGFGEPVGPARLVHRHRRRRKTFDRNNKDCSDVRSQVEDKSNNCENQKGEESIIRCSPSSSVDMLKKDTSSSSLNMLSDRVPRQRVSDEIEGTSGWKLSNCPWNLQVIARSPGSLTRFMPDDIPGVTSPMVYIGMLFSWFAWHVEDHELHSLNFLHIGSPKTWYAVPGDYAFTFEEVIRSKAYGGGVDRLAALTLLGEKTTLLSPETVVASGIPCCRLVQNPGEFVVTFPRAYHIGFSHGFNCGEAANFGTPKWLSVAKEAAVRRAAMNFLPMLSHQQLLYLLTMSFIPRVPRSLLPGIRSSRLKDRQKEERELLVKKEFIEDILKENKLLTCILNRSSSYHAVLWDLESLSPSVINNSTIINPQTEDFDVEKDNKTLVHVEDEDMSSDFQIDSGTLPCVACGVLGYPFMSVIQPSPKVLFDNMPIKDDHPNIASSETQVDQSHEASTCSSKVNVENGWKWNMCNGYLRPRIFCLEHASKVEELLESIGGAKLLIICHSDFLKIKAQVSAIAEEIGSMFRYEDVELDDAGRDDLDLINLAIDNEQEDESLEDWTLKLNVNLGQSVKLKSSPDKMIHIIHSALTMDALAFADTSPTSSSVVSQSQAMIQWQATKSRSNRKSNRSMKTSSKEAVCVTKDVKLSEEAQMPKKEGKFIQYSRRRSFKSKQQDSVTNHDKNTNKVILDNSIPSQKHKQKCGVEDSSGSVSCATTIEKDEETTTSMQNEKECSREEVVNEDGLMETDVSIGSKKSDAKDENTPVSSCFTSTGGSKKRKMREVEQSDFDGFIRSPCEGLRPRGGKDTNTEKASSNVKEKSRKKSKSCSKVKIPEKDKQGSGSGSYRCDHEGCKLSFRSKREVGLHGKNRCPHDGCGKKFSSHRYSVLHFRVHEDTRPLKCTWKGCKMTFKWAWARTEHLRVHTGERPYKCTVEGCYRTFRFVSDYSRHRRKTGHNLHVKSNS